MDIIEDFGRPFSEILLNSYALVQILCLANVLIALLNNAYADICADGDDMFAAYFATKCVGLVRAPDQFVYPAPLNLLEVFLIAPLEYILPRNAYQQLNRAVQTVLFAGPLTVIALYESRIGAKTFSSRSIRLDMLDELGSGEADSKTQAMAAAINSQSVEDPADATSAEGQVVIARTSFKQLVTAFPAIKGGTEDDDDRDPTTAEVGSVKEEGDRQQQRLITELITQIKHLRDEVQQLKSGEIKPEASVKKEA